jgi:hypothetical protein
METRPMRKPFLSYYLSYFARPGRTVAELMHDSGRVRLSVFALLIPAVGYAVMYFCAWIGGGAPSSFKPWLAIPIDQYYKYDVFIVAPSMFLCWVLTAGVIQLLARLVSSTGSFEDTATALGFGIGVATWASLVHDLTDGVLGALGIIDMKAYEAALNSPTFWRALLWTLYSVYFIWLTTLFTKGVRAVYRLGWISSAGLGLAAVIVYQGMYLVFNR